MIAKNSGATIQQSLESVAFADEIIVLDSGSTDDTLVKAQRHATLVQQTDWPGFGAQKQRALLMAKNDWVLNLDSDEFVDEALKQSILKAMNNDHADGYKIPIRMVFYGKPLRFSCSPKRHVRLFKRKGANFSDSLVHEKIILPDHSRILRIKDPILHHSYRDVSHALSKINLYSSYSAQTRLLEHKSTTMTRTLVSTVWMFFRCYVLQAGFMDGKPGLIFALFQAQGSWYRGIKQLYPDASSSQ